MTWIDAAIWFIWAGFVFISFVFCLFVWEWIRFKRYRAAIRAAWEGDTDGD